MDKRFQVFVSSTFQDLIEERREVMQALLEMDCIPAGMELFPAANEQAWTLIKRVIEESDYYCLIIGGRYGSTDERGLSYTEREYSYAVKVELPILPFLHAYPDNIPAGKVDRNEKAAKRLREFRAKVESQHHSKYWASAEDLGGKVSRAMVQVFKTTPRVGWVRADQVPSAKTFNEFEKLRQRAEELQAEVNRLGKMPPPRVDGLAHGEDLVPFSFSYFLYTAPPPANPKAVRASKKVVQPMPLSWDEVFKVMGPQMFGGDGEWGIRRALEQRLETIKQGDPEFMSGEGHRVDVVEADVLAMLTQFIVLGLVEVAEKTERGRTATQWRLTRHGRDYLLRIAAIPRTQGAGAQRSQSKTRGTNANVKTPAANR
jgi:Domain of unknown function (DUF4062)